MAQAGTLPSPTLIPNGFKDWKDTLFHTNSNRVKPQHQWVAVDAQKLIIWVVFWPPIGPGDRQQEVTELVSSVAYCTSHYCVGHLEESTYSKEIIVCILFFFSPKKRYLFNSKDTARKEAFFLYTCQFQPPHQFSKGSFVKMLAGHLWWQQSNKSLSAHSKET